MELGALVRVHDRSGDDLGLCHVPAPVELDDVVAFETGARDAETQERCGVAGTGATGLEPATSGVRGRAGGSGSYPPKSSEP